MTVRRGTGGPGRPGSALHGAADARWRGLATLVRARLLVALIAIPAGVMLRPDAGPAAGIVLVWSLALLAASSAAFWGGLALRRGLRLQIYLNLLADLVLVTALAARTGGRESQFVLFYVLVVITGGLLERLPGGLFAATGACAAYLLALAPGVAPLAGDVLPRPGMMGGFLVIVGVLAGMLGRGVRRAHDDLARTTRELHRVRVDNDVILRHLATGVLTVDAWGTVAYLNPAAETVLGVRTLEARGRRIRDAFPERLGALRDLVLDTLARGASRNRAELVVRSVRGAEQPLGISTNLLMHEDTATGVVAVFQDLTDVREMERRARRNQTLAELGALAAGIAHELRNGLKPISGSVEFLQRELRPEGENAVLLGLIATESARLNRFVTDLLTYARERDLALEAQDLDEQLAELCDGLTRDPRCGTGLRVRFERRGEPGTIRGDREQLRQVWLNLANNAFEAMKDGGTLTVRWRPAEDGRVVVEFEDEGPGIPAEDLPRVGEPFFTTKEGGTGLGVAIAQRIVERHGGTLAYRSVPGRGAVAGVILPACVEALIQAA
ncbi:MAG: PAS domain S-box protein [Candidatus Eisenbacteria bacterium]|nr:PAS domain S-box protein [Candidatus Eisenbacteria bacterium]